MKFKILVFETEVQRSSFRDFQNLVLMIFKLDVKVPLDWNSVKLAKHCCFLMTVFKKLQNVWKFQYLFRRLHNIRYSLLVKGRPAGTVVSYVHLQKHLSTPVLAGTGKGRRLCRNLHPGNRCVNGKNLCQHRRLYFIRHDRHGWWQRGAWRLSRKVSAESLTRCGSEGSLEPLFCGSDWTG